jgi:hypothetical protein
MRAFFLIVVMATAVGCGTSMSDHRGAPPGATGVAAVPIDPEAARLDSRLYPRFRISKVVTPPRWTSPYNKDFKSRYPMVDILPSDEWVVRHKVGDSYLIVSAAYDERQCKSLLAHGPGAGCFKSPFGDRYHSDYLYAVFITPDGRPAGGWKLLKNPEQVVLSSERRIHMSPSPWGNEGWDGIVFVEQR